VSDARYSVGIDLGTTHSALSYQRLDAEKGRGAQQPVLPIPQLTAPGTVEDRQLLPSFLYLPMAEEFPKDALKLPWKSDGTVAGELARSHGVKVPTRMVSSAKSWLCHPGVDRRGAILPFNAPADVPKISPVEAQARLLGHIEAAWDKAFGKEAPLEKQNVVVTVPASFDAAARDLTLEAAKQAGFGEVTLLEEPQAALYAWLEAQGEGFRKQLKAGDVILVVDVGGGTSDFSLIAVNDSGGDLSLERLAVGDHILLGGDNMDLALAYSANEQFKAQGKTLDNWQMVALTASCRVAKETLFEKAKLEKAPLVVPGRGSSLMGGTIKGELPRETLMQLLVDGFFPRVKVEEVPRVAARSGLQQLGLPYAQDAAITRHLAHFLTRQAVSLPQAAKGKSFVHPTCILFNGGVFKADALRQRVKDVVDAWLSAEKAPAARELEGADLDLSVARGAAHYGWVKAGHGIRIRGGTARAYYVGVESSMPAVPGFAPRVKALCVAPFGMEEGSQADVPPQEFGLVVGEATRFRFFSSSTRRADRVGDMLDDAEGTPDLEELPPIESTLPASGKDKSQLVPIQMQAAVTELGQLELRCLERGGKGKWKLELNVRLKE
jgi:hypothetical protein